MQRATTTSPPLTEEPDPITTCQNCFNGLTNTEQIEFEAQLQNIGDGTIDSIEEMCEFIDQNPGDAFDVIADAQMILESIETITPDELNSINTCLLDAFNVTPP